MRGRESHLPRPGRTALPGPYAAHRGRPPSPGRRAIRPVACSSRHPPPSSPTGFYYDATARHFVVNITDPSAAAPVRAAGAVPRTVRYSTTRLRAATTTLTRRARIPGTAWAIDPRQDKVVVTVDPTVTGTRLTQLNAVTHALGDQVVIRRAASAFKPLISGGDVIWGSTVRCSLGFDVSVNASPYFITAGHCGNAA